MYYSVNNIFYDKINNIIRLLSDVGNNDNTSKIIEDGDAYKVTADVPGVNQENINVSISSEHELIIIAREDSRIYTYSFKIPDNIDISNYIMMLKNGVLTITFQMKKEKNNKESIKLSFSN